MRVFVYEYTCAAGMAQLSEGGSLHSEGWAMLASILDDFARLPGVETTTLLHGRLSAQLRAIVIRRLRDEDEREAFQELAGAADWTLAIAPEFDDLLLNRCRWLHDAGGHWLGTTADAIELTGDKLALGQHLQTHGVATPACLALTDLDSLPALSMPFVVKPRHGAGSQATFKIDKPSDYVGVRQAIAREDWQGAMIAQAFVAGLPASVAFFIGPKQTLPMLPAEQHLSNDGRFHYLGGEMPLPAVLAERALALGQQAVAAVPGLMGYVGIDLILATDGDQDCVIEINPRLTTSYLGLRALAQENLAEILLKIAAGERVRALSWRKQPVRFRAEGTIISLGTLS